ncbi:MAG: DUF6636 domain-containing protein [Nocardioidaceae bacterium]
MNRIIRTSASIVGAVALTAVLLVAATGSADAATRHEHWFSSPSGNIGCYMTKHYVRCDIAEHRWKSPKRPAWCRLDYGDGRHLTKKAAWVCAGDTVLGSNKVLRYGQRSTFGRYRCTSKRTGMRCVNHRTHHGFKLSRQVHRKF